MKQFFKMFFASLLAMIVASVIAVGLLIAAIAGISKSIMDKETKKSTGDVLVIDLKKQIREQGQNNSLAILNRDEGGEAGLYDIMKGIAQAKTDPQIKGILLKLSPTPNGWATLQQVRMALQDFKKSGKFIYAYGEQITQGAYYVANVADSVYVNPAGSIELKGLSSTLAFFKGTLDKLELTPEIYYAGKFKSATEPFRAEKMSEPNRQQVAAIQNGVWNEFLSSAAQYTHTSKEAVNKLAVDGSVQFPADAVRYNLIAGKLYWDEVEQRIRAKTGQKETENIKYVAIKDYDLSDKNDGKDIDSKIAVIFADGQIIDGEQTNEKEIASKTFCETIRKVRNNDKIKSVVLRVNSPGGSALASEVILRELNLLKQKKHLIVSMGDYAASGGYYIASHADSIFALPNTITGSIGVFSMLFSMDKLAKNKLGITFDGVKNAPFADVPTTSRPLTPVEAMRMQNSVDTIYTIFKNHVSTGRRLSPANVDSIAQGRVWSGSDALNNGLVDRLGGLDMAIASAARIANIKEYKIVTYPEPFDKFSAFLKKLGNNTGASEAVKTTIREEAGEEYAWYEKLQSLRKMNGKTMMAMPFVFKVD